MMRMSHLVEGCVDTVECDPVGDHGVEVDESIS